MKNLEKREVRSRNKVR